MVPLAEDFIQARAAAIVEARRERVTDHGMERRWWPVGAFMFVLGLASAGGWWLLAMTPATDILPRLLP